MYGDYSSSLEQKSTLAGIHFIILLLVFWLLFLNGIDWVTALIGFPRVTGNGARRILILSGGLLYFIKEIYTEFIFLKRELKWIEALTMALWLFILYMTFSFTGGYNSNKPGFIVYLGIVFYLLGAFINSGSEFLRYRWKLKPENKGKLYTGGFFKLSRHINYFGDVVLFIGFAMFTGSVYSYIIPAAMIVLFVVVNIPLLDNYLKEKYGEQFIEYSSHTKKFIPFVY